MRAGDSGSLRAIQSKFRSLECPRPDALHGAWKAGFVGPLWLRATAPSMIALGGLKGWFGKEFFSSGVAKNITVNAGRRRHKLKMATSVADSFVDRKPSIALHYDKSSPLPWRFIVDELRQIDDSSLLGMTTIDLPLLRRFSFPFLLKREAAAGAESLRAVH